MSEAFQVAFDLLKRSNEKPMCSECGFPIDPTNEIHLPGAECICDLKERR